MSESMPDRDAPDRCAPASDRGAAVTQPQERSEGVEPRTKHGDCHTEPCRSLLCPCFISGEHDPTGADHMEEMWVHAQRADHAEALLRRALRGHDAIVAAYRAGGRRTPNKAVDDMLAVKAAAIEMGCYPVRYEPKVRAASHYCEPCANGEHGACVGVLATDTAGWLVTCPCREPVSEAEAAGAPRSAADSEAPK